MIIQMSLIDCYSLLWIITCELKINKCNIDLYKLYKTLILEVNPKHP